MSNSPGLIRVSTMPILAYTPQFVAEALNFYEDEGLKVEFVFGTPDLGLISATLEGRADLVLGNILFALRFPGPDGLTPVIQSNQTTRYVISARASDPPAGEFEWSDLKGRVVFIPSQLPTPWVAFREALHRNGVPLGDVRPIVGYKASEALSEFIDGVGDYLMSEVEVGQDQRVREVVALGDVLGRIPWSVYCAPRAKLSVQKEEIRAFGRAIERAQGWIAAHSAEEIAGILEQRFADTDPDRRIRILDRYKRLHVWPESSELRADEAEAWQGMMLRWGILPESNRTSLDDLVAEVNRQLWG